MEGVDAAETALASATRSTSGENGSDGNGGAARTEDQSSLGDFE
jgi:hypothetical protein